jgi:hypothetical protein
MLQFIGSNLAFAATVLHRTKNAALRANLVGRRNGRPLFITPPNGNAPSIAQSPRQARCQAQSKSNVEAKTRECLPVAGEGRHGSIMPNPGRVRSRNDMERLIETEIKRVEWAWPRTSRRRNSQGPGPFDGTEGGALSFSRLHAALALSSSRSHRKRRPIASHCRPSRYHSRSRNHRSRTPRNGGGGGNDHGSGHGSMQCVRSIPEHVRR